MVRALGFGEALEPLLAAFASAATEPLDDQGRVGLRIVFVDERAKPAVINCRGEAEVSADCRCLRALMRPPRPLEIEDLPVFVSQSHLRQACQ